MDAALVRCIRERSHQMYQNCDDITVLEDYIRFANDHGGVPPETIEAMKERGLLKPGDLHQDIVTRLEEMKTIARELVSPSPIQNRKKDGLDKAISEIQKGEENDW